MHPLARPEFDDGAAPSDLPLDRMLLVLKRSPEQEGALKQLISDQNNPSSLLFHKWLTPDEFGRRFGVAPGDIQVVSGWLRSHGFRITRVSHGRNVIEFSGNAGQVENAFRTPIHRYIVNGKQHWANETDPEIPAALASVVAGVATIHNFAPKPAHVAVGQKFTGMAKGGLFPATTFSNNNHALSPADFSKIYNIDALTKQNVDGTGVTIAVVARSNFYMNDIDNFQEVFGLQPNRPEVIVNGTNPGVLETDEEAEVVLDTEWAGAVAPGAKVKVVVSSSTDSTDGVFLSEEYIVDNDLADVMTESFGTCEAYATRSLANLIETTAQQAAAEGITYLVSTGDSGSSGCDGADAAYARGPISVNLLASTPYNIAVGGTQFNEGVNSSAYWANSNSAGGVSALSYIPETTWNENGQDDGVGLLATGGGASRFFPRPEWQTGTPGIPNDGMRDLPDVSLSAAGHDPYLICMNGSCEPDSQGMISFWGISGTSAATPAFAGIVARIDQLTNSRQGQADYALYAISAQTANSCIGSQNNSTCPFHDITTGTNAVPHDPSAPATPAVYSAGSGYDQATGLGSVDAWNLSQAWLSATQATGTLSTSAQSLTFSSQQVGVLSAPQSFVLTNQGSGTVTVGNLLLSGPNANEFSIVRTCFPWVAPGSTCTVFVTFTPQATGTRTASITVNGKQVISLAGSGSGTGTFEIVNKLSGKALDVKGISGDAGAAIQQWDFHGGPNQQWQFVPVDNGAYYKIVSLLSGKVLDVNNVSSDDGATIHQWDYYGGDSQKWEIEPAGGSYYKITNKWSGKALDMANSSLANGGALQQWTYYSGDNQKWQFIPVQYYSIQNKASGKVVDVADASTADHAPIHQWGYWGGENQQWQLVAVDDSYYEIINKLSGKVLNDTGESTGNGNPMEQLDFTNDDAQKWQLIPVDSNNWKLLNKLTGKCLEVQDFEQYDGATIQQWDFVGGDNQEWHISPSR